MLASLMLLTLAGTPLAQGWTPPLIISNAGTGFEASVPRIAPGFGSRVLVAYQQKDWRVRYRERSAGGTWGPIEILSPSGVFASGPVVAEDIQGRPRVIYSEAASDGSLDLIDTWKQGGVWQRANITNSLGRWDAYAVVEPDSVGRLHLVYADYIDGQGGSIVYRRWDGSWSGPTVLGSTDHPYYRRPDLSVDSAGKVHVVWANTGGDRFVVCYRRLDGGGWSSTIVVGQSVNGSWVGTVRIGAASPTSIVIGWYDDTFRYVYSNNGGTGWSSMQSMSGFRLSNITGGQGTAWIGGTAYPDTSQVQVAYWTGSTWSPFERANPGEPRWKGWIDLTPTPNGALHVVYDDVIDDVNTHEIAYVMRPAQVPTGTVSGLVRDQSGPLPGATVTGSLGGQTTTNAQGNYVLTSPAGTITVRASRPGYPDVDVPGVAVVAGQNTPLADIVMTAPAPAPVTGLMLVPGNAQVTLSWTNPASLNFSGTMIRVRTDTFPTGPTDGTLVADRTAAPGSADSFTHTGLTNGRTHYYALFAHDDRPIRSYSAATTGSALPFMQLDRDKDGDVDQQDFGRFQGCYSGPFIPQNDPDCLPADVDGDTDVDGDDLVRFLRCMGPPGVVAPPNCAD